MMRKIVFILLLFSVYAGSTAAQQKTYTPPAEAVTTLDNGVVKYSNLRYGPIPDTIPDMRSDRILDLYLPADASAGKPLPVFMFVHGGGFGGGDKGLHPDFYPKIVAQGFAVMSINYRLRFTYVKKPAGSGRQWNQRPRQGQPRIPRWYLQGCYDASHDAEMALGWIKENAAKYHLDADNVFIGGGSAGGMTVLHLAYESGQQTLPIKGVVNFWGGLNDASVIQPGAPPALLYHGDHDATVHYGYSVAVKDRMDEIGEKRTILHVMGGQGHAAYKYISANRTDEIVAFFKKIMKK